MAIQDGKVYFLTGEGATYAAQISGSFDGDTNMIEITSKDSAGFREYLAGLKGGTISFDALNDWADSDGFSRPFGQWANGTSVTFVLGGIALVIFK